MRYQIINSATGQLVDTVNVPKSKYSEMIAKFPGCYGKKDTSESDELLIASRPEFSTFTYCSDAWTSGNPGMGGFQVKRYDKSHKAWIESVPARNSELPHTNNYFEIYGILVACQKAIQDRDRYAKGKLVDITIYTDSKTALGWITKPPNNANEKEAIVQIGNNIKSYLDGGSIKIVKWDTKQWGEIPADFGRKA
jgi:ribonuclease HI